MYIIDVYKMLGLATQPCYEATGDLRVEYVQNAMINIRLVRLSPSRMAQSWPWDRQIASKKKKNVSHILTNFYIYFAYRIKRNMAAKICIQNVKKIDEIAYILNTFCIHQFWSTESIYTS